MHHLTLKRLVFLAAFLLFLFIAPAKGDDIWGSYCARPPLGGDFECRGTAVEVLNEVAAPNTPPVEWIARDTLSVSDSGVTLAWYTAFEPPETIADPIYYYSFHEFGGDCPIDGCKSEQEAIDLILDELGSQAVSYSTTGTYSFVSASSSDLYFGDRTLSVILTNGSVDTFPISQYKPYFCRYPYGHGGVGVPIDELCGNEGPFYVTSSNLQRRSCPANANPCFPTTGDKARFEEDFVFAGKAFIRTYHSTQQAFMPGMATGWWSSYGQRGDYHSAYDEFGYFDGLQAKSDGRYYSQLTPGRFGFTTDTGFAVIEPDGTRNDFDASSYLLKTYSPSDGTSVTVASDALHRISTLTDDKGRIVHFYYTDDTDSGVLDHIDLPDGGQVQYFYDTAGNLERVKHADGSERTYLYDEPQLSSGPTKHLLTGIVDGSTRYASFAYDARGRVLSSGLHGANGMVESTAIQYGTTSSAIVTTDGAGVRNMTFATDIVPYMSSVTTDGVFQGSGYNQNGLPKSRTSSSGISTTYSYSSNGMIILSGKCLKAVGALVRLGPRRLPMTLMRLVVR